MTSTCKLLCYMSVFTGPTQAYQSMYPPTGCYGAPPQQHRYPTVPAQTTPAPNKASFTNSANYYHSNHQQQHHLQHNVASSTYNAPLSSAPPSQPYASLSSSRLSPSNVQYNQQHPPYATPGSYYGPRAYHAPSAQPSQGQQPGLVPAPTAGPGAPLVPYPSTPGSGHHGSSSSSQSGCTLGGTTTQIAAPLHHYSGPRPASAVVVQHGYGTAPPAVNGQGSAGLCECLFTIVVAPVS